MTAIVTLARMSAPSIPKSAYASSLASPRRIAWPSSKTGSTQW